jgi:hypothetical protein
LHSSGNTLYGRYYIVKSSYHASQVLQTNGPKKCDANIL